MRWFIGLHKLEKKTILFILALSYISILFSFGFIYWHIANDSHGEFFIFQNDINMNTKVEVFRKSLNIPMYSKEFKNTIEYLIASNEYKRPIAKLETLNSSFSVNIFAFDKILGENWANYYYMLLQSKGITHISVENLGEDKVSSKFNSYKLKICFYKINEEEKYKEFKSYKKNDKNKFERVDIKYLWVNDYPLLHNELFRKDYFYYPLNFYFPKLMENSISFLDDSPLVLRAIVNGNFKYPIWNFMYFSAVTMTTLGYGDILPNSMIVRVLVMTETILGVMIIGMFVSCLFWEKK
ncbi:potassium channel family protein [Clostridium sp. WILCCON 0269]|uniref:Potassium channel family protein n=1 Tax=Candidatus Clostridium eludens TaxID=3381663 RepID=A0ABW8SML3_9CLOT